MSPAASLSMSRASKHSKGPKTQDFLGIDFKITTAFGTSMVNHSARRQNTCSNTSIRPCWFLGTKSCFKGKSITYWRTYGKKINLHISAVFTSTWRCNGWLLTPESHLPSCWSHISCFWRHWDSVLLETYSDLWTIFPMEQVMILYCNTIYTVHTDVWCRTSRVLAAITFWLAPCLFLPVDTTETLSKSELAKKQRPG